MNRLRTFLSLAFAVVIVLLAVDFWRFAENVRKPAQTPPHADAIVALTGGSSQRLETGVRLLKDGKGGRLLISGVNRDVADNELFSAIGVDAHLGQCCVDLGRSAEDTLGNAAETAAWAHRRHYTSLILVTDDFHMPRARTELALALPDVTIYPYPVRTRWTDPALWRSYLSVAGRSRGEYVKYVMIRTREALIEMSGAHKRGEGDHAKA
ncbi:MAG: YdcF family protein [Pseudomonadota bacterium]